MLRTRSRILRRAALCSVLLSLPACADAIHLDPGAGGSSSSHSASGTGGSGPIGCASNSDCPYPTAVCNTVQGVCVACLTVDDCAAKPGTVCSKSTCVCPGAGDSFCAGDAPGSGSCVDLKTSQTDCGQCGHACFGACAAGKCVDPWEPTAATSAPAARAWHTAIWTGSVMIVWGGLGASGPLSDGATYDPKKRVWTAIDPVGAPTPRYRHSAVWDSAHNKMIVFGGTDGSHESAGGGAYDVATHHWSTISGDGAPGPRQLHGAAFASGNMFIWGGENAGTALGDGASYTTASDTWSPMAAGAPSARREHVMVAAGSKIVVWGGYGDDSMGTPDQYLSDGAVLVNGAWMALNPSGAPSARRFASAVVSGTNVLVFGGYAGSDPFSDGALYPAGGDGAWTAFMGPTPDARAFHTAVLVTAGAPTMLVWGGQGIGGTFLASGAGLTASPPSWSSTIPSAPQGRYGHTAVSTGTTMIVWGGQIGGGNAFTSTGGVFDAAP
jgi:N-acetylneuraminic acid mutarotase